MMNLVRCLPLMAMVCLMSHLRMAPALPVEDTFAASGSARSSRMRQSVSPVYIPHPMKRKVIRPADLPSPADLLRPDTFQFYTFDKSGEVVTKQMTKHEIQSLIAAGGGHLPPMAIENQEPHKAGDVPTGGTRVADVVQNVQNVLKGELSKPVPIISTIPKIPGHASSEWSSILPSILSGDMETIALQAEPARPQYPAVEERIPVYVGPGYIELTEKPMIQVPVITVEDKSTIPNNTPSPTIDHDSHEDSENDGPVFQILNTISADRVKNNSYSFGNDQMTDASEAIDQANVKPQIVAENWTVPSSTAKPIEETESVISIVSETHSTSVKVDGQAEVKIEDQSGLQTRRPVEAPTTEKIADEVTVITQKPETSTPGPVKIDDKVEVIQPIKPVLLNNVLKPEALTTSSPEVTTVKILETVSTLKEEPVTEATTAESTAKTSLNATSDITNSSLTESTTYKTTAVSHADATSEAVPSESISTAPVLVPKTNASAEPTASPFTETVELEDSATEVIPPSTPEVTERTNPVTITIDQITVTNSIIESSTLISTIQPEGAGLPTELEDSLSSMISQISASIIEQSPMKNESVDSDSSTTEVASQEINSTISPAISEDTTTSESAPISPSDDSLRLNATSDPVSRSTPKPSAKPESETPIVRIDIMSPTQLPEASPKLNASSEESPVVRIQLMDPVTTVNHIIESLPPESYSLAPEVEPLTLPSRGSITANNVSSSLIAGFSNNAKPIQNITKITDDRILVEPALKDEENVKVEEKTEANEEWLDYEKTMEMLHQINFDELPMYQASDKIPSIEKKNNQKIEPTAEPDTAAPKHTNATLESSSRLPVEAEPKDDSKSVIGTDNPQDKPPVNVEAETEAEAKTESPILSTSIPSKIQLDDLPIVPSKFHKLEEEKPLPPKRNITENYKKDEALEVKPPIPPITANAYADDPYKKLGETIEPRVSTTELPQTTSIKPLKLKDQKKDSSMETMEKLPLIPINQLPVETERKPLTTTTTAPVKKQEEPSTDSDKWTLIPQKSPPTLKLGGPSKRPADGSTTSAPETTTSQQHQTDKIPLTHSKTDDALDSSIKSLEPDVTYFSNLCNDLAFSFWTATNEGLSTTRSLAVSPFGMTSMLAMVFLGARGPTSEKMNNLLKLDDVASFNPHLIFQNVTDSVGLARKQGIANAAFVRELFADRVKVRKLLPFYKEQAQQFYDGVVAEVNFATINDLVRRRTNLMVRKQTGGRIKDFVRTNSVSLTSPLAALSANVFQTDCNSKDASSDGRDGELYFAVSPAIRQRKLVPIPATVWRSGILAGYEPNLDATAIALGGPEKLVSTIFVIPGQQGFTAPGDNLELLEQRLVVGATHDGAWNKLLKVIIPRAGLELQVPKFSHRSVINATAALKRMGLQALFDKHADLKGINGVGADLHLTDILQMNLFSTCGDENTQTGRHHVEVYPASPQKNSRSSDLSWGYKPKSAEQVPSVLREDLDKPRLKLDRPFLYFVRHNPTGLILHMGRFNPRLLP